MQTGDRPRVVRNKSRVTEQMIVDVFRAHPTWTAQQVAEHLHCNHGHVRAVGIKRDLRFIKKPYERYAGGSIQRLGEECKRAGLTIADIQAIAAQKGDRHV